MVRNYKGTTGRRNKSTRPQAVPPKFKAGFLQDMDARTELVKALRSNYDAIVKDVGGRDDVGHIKGALVERFVWLECILQSLEQEMAKGSLDKAEGLGRWVQAVNALSGLAKVLGVERRAKHMPWLAVPNGDGGTTKVVATAKLPNGFKELPTNGDAEHD